MVQHLGLLLILLLSHSVLAQDERYYRQILNGELPSYGLELQEAQEHQFNVNGASYSIDLNGDGIEELVQPQKRDGVDWIEIKDSSLRKIFDAKLLAMGSESYIYKLRLAHLSSKTKLLLIYLDEGATAGKKFESTGRIFLLTFDNNDLSTIHISSGPHHFHEKEAHREKYWRRDYAVEIRDINKDGIRDVIVEFNHIQRIMLYKGSGEWERL
jgi:hypothetical protein